MIPILMYHQIADIPEAQNPNRYSVTPQMFESQMSYLTSRGYQCISLLDAVNHVRNKQRIPRKSIVITFDDGYLDFYINALPILERFGLVATIFVVAERVGYKSDWPGMQGQNSAELMNWTQLDEICRSGMTVGSHTMTHARLPQLAYSDALREVRDSKCLIEDRLGRPVDLFSYPHEASSELLQNVVADCGYLGANGSGSPWSVFNMWRLQCGRNDTQFTFAVKAHGLPYIKEKLRNNSVLSPPLKSIRNLLRHGVRSRYS